MNDKQRHHSPPSQLSLHAPQDWPELLSPSQAGQLLQIKTQTVGRWCEEGTIEAVKMGRLWRIPAEAVWPLVPASIRAKWPDGPWKERTDGGQ